MYLKTFEETVKTYSDEAAKITKSRESETGKKKLADSWKCKFFFIFIFFFFFFFFCFFFQKMK